MKRFSVSAIALLLLVILGVGAQGRGETGVADEPGARSVFVEDFKYLLEPVAMLEFLAEPPDGFFLVDARTSAEYADGHIPTAIQIDYRDIGDDPPTAEKDALIIVYCQSGNRSRSAAKTLAGLGYTQVLDWGGIGNWPYEIVTGSNPE